VYRTAAAAVAALLFGGSFVPLPAEEGMWTFDNPPVDRLRKSYDFSPTPDWLDHVRLASLRINDGGSGSFVSPRGLILTNHHVAGGQIQKLSTPQKDYYKEGFSARSISEELRCPDLEVNVLVSMEDVTRRVLQAAARAAGEAEAFQARQAEIGAIEKESLESTGLRSDVVPLYEGGEYWLYRYRKYTDIRLVFAPEAQAAYFGGDPDNFTYPRFNLDFTLLRAYEDGKPAETPHYLKWNAAGPAEGDLVFVSGNPGSTSRLKTLAQLETERDYFLPRFLASLKRRLAALRAYEARGAEQARQVAGRILGAENGIKAIGGMLAGLSDPAVWAKKTAEEKAFREKVSTKPEWKEQYGWAWSAIARAEKKHRQRYDALLFRGFRSSATLANKALTVVQLASEAEKPDAERMEEYHEAGLESVRFGLYSKAPVFAGLEEAMLADSLAESLAVLGPADPFNQAVLGGRSPEEVAREAIRGTGMADPEFRRRLVEGGPGAVGASDDPLIALARKVDPFDREMTKWLEDIVESVNTRAAEAIGQARFAIYGRSVYPDATFTPRLSYGTVRGYPANGGQAAPWTTFYGLYDRAHAFRMQPPYDLTDRFLKKKVSFDLATPLNFVSTLDVTGGNSGSPVVNREGELVGLVFDGNIQSLAGDYVYEIERNRTIAVHAGAILQTIRDVYGAAPVAEELTGKTPRKKPRG
jgi:hypothetical protein